MRRHQVQTTLHFAIVSMIAFLTASCSMTAAKRAPNAAAASSQGGLNAGNGMSEDSQSEKVLSTFCDASYIAIQSTQEISPSEVADRFADLKAARSKWRNVASVNELLQASIISDTNTEKTIETFEKMVDQFASSFPEEISAELTKSALVNHRKPSDVASRFKDIRGLRKWGSLTAIAELTKASLFGQKSPEFIRGIYEDFARRQGKEGKEMELVELTKAALLSGRTPHEILRAFDQIESRNQGFVNRIRVAELTRIAMMTGASPKMVFYRFAELSMKKNEEYSTAKILELTKYSILSRKTANDLIEIFDRASKGSEKSLAFSLFSGEILQDSTFGAHVDECNGAHARLFLTVDTYRGT